MSLRFSLVLAAFLLLLPVPVLADSYPKPTVEYSADLSLSVSGGGGSVTPGPMTGKVYDGKTAERRELVMEGHRSVIIMKKGSPTVLVLMPEQQMYMEQTPPPDADPERAMKEGQVTIKKVGSEKVNGQNAVKYKLEAADKTGKVFDGHVWLTKENIPVRMDGTTGKGGRLRMDYTNIKIGPQNPALFAVPAGYTKMGTPKMPEMSEGGMSPEQKKQMEEMIKKMQKPSPKSK
jgi:hypothetical protein